jgi:hypothetical protein
MLTAKELLAFGALVAVCGFLASQGDPVGWIGLLFFGGGGAVLWMSRREPRSDAPRRARHGVLAGARRHAAEPRGVVVRTRRQSLAVGVAGAAIFVIAGIWMIGAAREAIENGERFASRSPAGALIAGIVCVLFFGALLIYLLAALVRPGGLALLREGVWCRQPAGSWWLPWDAIAKISVVRFMDQRFVGLRARSADAGAVAGASRWARGWNRRRLGADVTFLSRGTMDADQLRALIQRYLDDPRARDRLADPGEAERLE